MVWGEIPEIKRKNKQRKRPGPIAFYGTSLLKPLSHITPDLRKHARSSSQSGSYPTTSGRNCCCCLQPNRPLTQPSQLLTRCDELITKWLLYNSWSKPNDFKECLAAAVIPLSQLSRNCLTVPWGGYHFGWTPACWFFCLQNKAAFWNDILGVFFFFFSDLRTLHNDNHNNNKHCNIEIESINS